MTEIKIMVEVSNEDGGWWRMGLDLEVRYIDFASLSIDEGYAMLSNIAQIELDRLEKIDKWTLESIIDFKIPGK
ncbi:MAG: hypothetical protein MUP21_13520 [Dehalococcoidia bacterium]|nr:hypothetical protein [Dehalococcoidia bacterium]